MASGFEAFTVFGPLTLADLFKAFRALYYDYTNEAAFGTVVAFCKTRWEIVLSFCAAYLLMVFLCRNGIRAHSFGGVVDNLFALWNLGLSLFSTWGFCNMAYTLAQVVPARGFHFSVCADTMTLLGFSESKPVALALSLFCFSKIPELGDTIFLILKRKPVRFLQWYHHSTVMLFCWLALATEFTPGIWFATTNYFVHSVMYMYFFLMRFKVKALVTILKKLAPFITIIQTTQMVWGLIVNATGVISFLTTGSCQIQAVTVYCAAGMYASYFVLFSQLFLESQGSAKKREEPQQGIARSVSRRLSQSLLDRMEDEDEEEDDGKKKN
jgi:hypothetical protein